MRLILLSGVAAALLLGAETAAGAVPMRMQQRPPASDTLSRRANERAQALEAVRVTGHRTSTAYTSSNSTSASRTDLPLLDTPRAVSIATSALIADQSMQGMADVVRYVPGVSMGQGEGHRDAPTIRGNSSTADFFIDGIRDDAQYLRDLYNAERVEVLKGPEALLFGRGGGGGIINRVTRQAGWDPVLSVTAEGGSFDHKRAIIDAGEGFNSNVAGRLTGMYEKSGGFRDAAAITRYGINPHLTLRAGARTTVRFGYELFDDRRSVDRGIPSYLGAPAPTDIETFFGNPDVNHASSHVNVASASVEHRLGRVFTFRNRTTWADYDKFYQNTVPRDVNAGGTEVTLSAYNHGIARRNLINVADVTGTIRTGPIGHTLLAGVDLSRQHTDQVRLTGYYGDSAATYVAPFDSPTVSTPVTFRASATDANNQTVVTDAAAYLQDQIELSPALLLVAGVRYERFDIDYTNNRDGQKLSRVDKLVSPRAGVVYKPASAMSVYASYGVSHLPSSGDQFTSLTATSAALEPERFTNREVGAKWEIRPELSLTTSVYRVDRTNTKAPDPNEPGAIVQTGAQRTTGWELGASGSLSERWRFMAGIGSQQATIRSTTTAATSGATVALVPHSTYSLWNRYQVTSRYGVGLGVVGQTAMYAAVENSVTLPGFTRVDAAVYATLRPGLRAQINIENLLNRRYFATSHGNNNIMPGAPRTIRVGLVASR
ncbi:MAG TPA: TonB-dependent siderophore receptor [Gemmatimonadaceae bacterium]|nr:TonB-dependent siderophore receptor [Gemmatimonadaceae bacterium]